MRIICPNCQARYDIPDAAIPPSGREVQCAVCTRAWYQLPLSAASGAETDDNGSETAPDASARAQAEATAEAAAPSPEAEDLPKRELDPAVVAILREEAEREARVRAGKSTDETPTPAKPETTSPAEGSARARLARLQAAEKAATAPKLEPDTEALVEDPDADARDTRPPMLTNLPAPLPPDARRSGRGRRDLPVALTQTEIAEAEERRQRVGFRLGFGLTAGLCCTALALYLAAPYAASVLPNGTPYADKLIEHGNKVQAHLVNTIDRWLGGGTTPL